MAMLFFARQSWWIWTASSGSMCWGRMNHLIWHKNEFAFFFKFMQTLGHSSQSELRTSRRAQTVCRLSQIRRHRIQCHRWRRIYVRDLGLASRTRESLQSFCNDKENLRKPWNDRAYSFGSNVGQGLTRFWISYCQPIPFPHSLPEKIVMIS